MKNWNPVETAPVDVYVLVVVGSNACGPEFVEVGKKCKAMRGDEPIWRYYSSSHIENYGFRVLGWLPIPEMV